MPVGIGYGPAIGTAGGLAPEPLQTSNEAQQARQIASEEQQTRIEPIEEGPVSESLGQSINTLA